MPAPNQTTIRQELAEEEIESIVAKLTVLSQENSHNIETDQVLYLEQQLTDLFGFVVTAELDGHRLEEISGTMAAQAHLKRSATDQLADHQLILEAGLRQHRSFFGWFARNGALTSQEKNYERYSVSLPIPLYSPESISPGAQNDWYRFRKVLVINPVAEKAIVAVVGDLGVQNALKAQFSGSPELITEGLIWHPQAKGRVILFFVEDPEDKVILGPIPLRPSLVQ